MVRISFRYSTSLVFLLRPYLSEQVDVGFICCCLPNEDRRHDGVLEWMGTLDSLETLSTYQSGPCGRRNIQFLFFAFLGFAEQRAEDTTHPKSAEGFCVS